MSAAAPPTQLPARQRLRRAIAAQELPNYVYSYPSKRAYRPITPAPSIREVWADAPSALNVYAHIPFCGYRCAFCTLFLMTGQTDELVDRYVDSLVSQARLYGELLEGRDVVSIYVGGGTPTSLTPTQLERLFAGLAEAFPRRDARLECSIEASPDTVTPELLACVRALGVNRLSMGLQTLDPEELRRVGRRYSADIVPSVIESVGAAGFENVNYDLIYGLEGQTRASWLRSLQATIAFAPQTITIYPVVFRPLTAIQKRRERDGDRFADDADKYDLYDLSVDVLAAAGYRQDSVVRFTTLDHDGYQQEAADFSGVPLVGLGAGARSYAPTVHYGTDFAVGRSATTEIIAGFVDHDHRADEPLTLGFVLDEEEQKRRWCVLNLSLGRLDPAAYAHRFPGSDLADFADELSALEEEDCVRVDGTGSVVLTAKGFKYSSVNATLFRSPAVTELERSYVPS
jgi:oxygen-independent coproporphyrinogen-3 oxidase